jgi:hypothetical protein
MTPSTRARWAAVLVDFERSGLCVREFCDRRGISAPMLYRRRRELAAPAFVEARVAMSPPPAPIVVELPTRELLRVPVNACPRTLAAILHAIAAVHAAAEGRA